MDVALFAPTLSALQDKNYHPHFTDDETEVKEEKPNTGKPLWSLTLEIKIGTIWEALVEGGG
jgi:hypothetical protein